MSSSLRMEQEFAKQMHEADKLSDRVGKLPICGALLTVIKFSAGLV